MSKALKTQEYKGYSLSFGTTDDFNINEYCLYLRIEKDNKCLIIRRTVTWFDMHVYEDMINEATGIIDFIEEQIIKAISNATAAAKEIFDSREKEIDSRFSVEVPDYTHSSNEEEKPKKDGLSSWFDDTDLERYLK